MRIGHIAAPIALTLLATAPGAADLQLASLREMSLSDVLEVDIGTGTSKFLHQAPAVAYVMTSADISRLGARDLLDVLQSVPGFFLYNLRAEVNEPLVDLRGGYSERGGSVLFLLDGRPMRTIDGVSMPEVVRIPVQLIERIEVMRGPASAIYGAEALTGAINIVTKKQPNEAGISLGSFGQQRAWGGKSGTLGELNWAISASYAKTREDVPTRSLNPPPRPAPGQPAVTPAVTPTALTFAQDFERDYRDLNLKLNLGAWSANVWAMNFTKTERGSLRNPRRLVSSDTQQRHVELSYTAALGEDGEIKATFLQTRYTLQSFGMLSPNPIRGPGTPALIPTDLGSDELHNGIDLNLTQKLGEQHRVRLNLGIARDERMPSDNNRPSTSYAPRTTRYVLLQDEFAFAPDWELTSGLRLDRYPDIGTASNPRLGLVWNASPSLTSKLLWGRAFRPPVKAPFIPGVTAAPSNQPERLSNTELAFDYRPSEHWRAALNMYVYRADDLMVFGGNGARLVQQDGRGGEFELSWLASPSLRFESSITFARVIDRQTRQSMPYTPSKSAKLSVDWSADQQWSFNLRWEGYWDRNRGATDLRPPLEALQLLNASVRYRLDDATSLALTAHNLLNNRAYLPVLHAARTDDEQLAARSALIQLETLF